MSVWFLSSLAVHEISVKLGLGHVYPSVWSKTIVALLSHTTRQQSLWMWPWAKYKHGIHLLVSKGGVFLEFNWNLTISYMLLRGFRGDCVFHSQKPILSSTQCSLCSICSLFMALWSMPACKGTEAILFCLGWNCVCDILVTASFEAVGVIDSVGLAQNQADQVRSTLN